MENDHKNASAVAHASSLTTAQILVAAGKKEEAIALLEGEIEGRVAGVKEADSVTSDLLATLIVSNEGYRKHNDSLKRIIAKIDGMGKLLNQLDEETKIVKVIEEIELLKAEKATGLSA